jgi:hypothetical protein
MTTPAAEVESAGITEDQAASALLAKWGASDDAPATEEVEEDQPESQAQADDDSQDDPDDETPEEAESGDVEIDVAGEKFKLPPALAEQAKRIEAKAKEVEAGATRKFQEAAEIRKAAETQFKTLQELQTIAHQQADIIADHKLVTRRLEELGNVNVNYLAENDPVALTKLNAEFNQLMAAKQRIESAYQQNVQANEKAKGSVNAERMQRLQQFAEKNVKGWSEDYSNKLMQFAVKDIGFDPDQLRQTVDEPLIRLIDLAYQGHKVRSADPKAKQVNTSKTLKPGSNAQAKTTATVTAEKAFSKLKKTGNVESAAMALLARSGTKRR